MNILSVWYQIGRNVILNMRDLDQIMKKNPNLKSLEKFDKSSYWDLLPNITIEKIKLQEYELTNFTKYSLY